jgi:hypothetical protein
MESDLEFIWNELKKIFLKEEIGIKTGLEVENEEKRLA